MSVASWCMAQTYDWAMRKTEERSLAGWRNELLRDLGGHVLEIGSGTGVNLSHYGALERLMMTEPDPHMRAKLNAKLAAAAPGFGVEVHNCGAETLPFDSNGFDAVVSTLVLCTIGDPTGALAEFRRVLRPGGKLVFLEHVAAEDNPGRLKWQTRLNPLWNIIAAGCNLTRQTEASIRAAGFEIESITRQSMRGAPPVVRPTIRGVAVRA